MANLKTLSKSAAKKLQNKMFQSSKDIQIHIHEFVERKGYKALGYDSLKEWCNTKKSCLPMSYDTLNNHLHAAKISLLMDEEAGTFFTYSILPMKNLTKEEVKKVIKQAKKYHHVNELTDEHFSTSLTEVFMKEAGLKEPTKKPKPKQNDDYSASDEDESNDDGRNESDGSDASSDEDDKPDGSDEEFIDLTTLQLGLIEELNTVSGSSETRQLGKAIMQIFSIKRQLRLCKTILKASKNERLEELADELSDFIKEL